MYTYSCVLLFASSNGNLAEVHVSNTAHRQHLRTFHNNHPRGVSGVIVPPVQRRTITPQETAKLCLLSFAEPSTADFAWRWDGPQIPCSLSP